MVVKKGGQPKRTKRSNEQGLPRSTSFWAMHYCMHQFVSTETTGTSLTHTHHTRSAAPHPITRDHAMPACGNSDGGAFDMVAAAKADSWVYSSIATTFFYWFTDNSLGIIYSGTVLTD